MGLTANQYATLRKVLRSYLYDDTYGPNPPPPTLTEPEFFAFLDTLNTDYSDGVKAVGPGLVLNSGELTLTAGISGVPTPDYVATSNIVLSGVQTVDGAVPANGKVVLCTAQTNQAENGYQAVNTGGAWAFAAFYNSDAEVAAALGVASGAVLNGALGKGTIWAQSSGATLTGAKTFVRLPDAGIVAATYTAPPPTGNPAIDTPALQAMCAFLVAHPGSTGKLSGGVAGVDYDVNQDLVLDAAEAITIIGPGGPTFAINSARVVTNQISRSTTLTTGFTQPALATPTVIVVGSNVGMIVGKVLKCVLAGGVNYYAVTAQNGNGTGLTIVVTEGNIAPGGSIPAGTLIETDDAIFRCHSAHGAKITGVTCVASDWRYLGTAVSFDGRILGNDCSNCTLEHSLVQTANFGNVSPALQASGTSPPADTLTGACGFGIRFRVEYVTTTTGRYTTNYNVDGGTDWTAFTTSGGAFSVLVEGVDTGLIYAPVNTAHNVDNVYTAGIAIRGGMAEGFNNSFRDCRLVFVYEGFYTAGADNEIKNIISANVGNVTAMATGARPTIRVDCEPGGVGYGRGGARVFASDGFDVDVISGDALHAGPWFTAEAGSGSIGGAYSIVNTATGPAAAAVRNLACRSMYVKGGSGFRDCGVVVDAPGGALGISGHLLIGAIDPPLNTPRLYTTAGTGGAGSGFSQIDQFAMNSGTRITGAQLLGIPTFTSGSKYPYAVVGLGATGDKHDLSFSLPYVIVSFTGPVDLSGIVPTNLGDGYTLTLMWGGGQGDLTVKHLSGTNSSSTYRISTPLARDLVIKDPGAGGLGYVVLYRIDSNNLWYVLSSSAQAAQSGTTTLVAGVSPTIVANVSANSSIVCPLRTPNTDAATRRYEALAADRTNGIAGSFKIKALSSAGSGAVNTADLSVVDWIVVTP